MLIDFLYRRNEGVLLLSGKRGVGKSSIVFTAIHETTEKCEKEDTKLLPILINAPTFEIHQSNQKDEENQDIDKEFTENKNSNNNTSLVKEKFNCIKANNSPKSCKKAISNTVKRRHNTI